MKRGKPLKWTPEAVAELVQRASTPGVTAKELADHYHLSIAGIHYVLKKYCDAQQLRKMRKQFVREKMEADYKQKITEALRACGGNHNTAAKSLHVSYSTFGDWTRKLFTKKELLALYPPRACIICGKRIESTHPTKKTCSAECAIKKNKIVSRKWREKHYRTWRLWKDRDYEMIHNLILLHRGYISKIARELKMDARAVQSAIRRWRLSRLALEQRRADFNERIARAYEMVTAGISVKDAGRAINMNETDVSIHLRTKYGAIARPCRVCGKAFVPVPAQKRCCSDECVMLGNKMRMTRARKRYEKKMRSMKPPKSQKPAIDTKITQRIEQIYSAGKYL